MTLLSPASIRAIPLTENATRILLEGIIDYAGLFPPAALTMPVAVRNYAHFRGSGSGWILGRFVCPADALEQFSIAADVLLPRDTGAIPWRLTVTGSDDIASDLASINAFNQRHRMCFDDRGAIADAYEVKAADVASVFRIDAACPDTLATYLEVPLDTSPHEIDAMIEAISRTDCRAKMRTGGLVPQAFPRAESIVAFLQSCLAHRVPAKATAGLHHVMRGSYQLQNDDPLSMCPMYGFLNLLLAAAVLAQGGSAASAVQLLRELNATSIEINDLHVRWRAPGTDCSFDRVLLQRVRQTVLTSFGSCSFTEPVDEWRALGFMQR